MAEKKRLMEKSGKLLKVLFVILGIQFLFALGYLVYTVITSKAVLWNVIVFVVTILVFVAVNYAVIKQINKEHNKNDLN